MLAYVDDGDELRSPLATGIYRALTSAAGFGKIIAMTNNEPIDMTATNDRRIALMREAKANTEVLVPGTAHRLPPRNRRSSVPPSGDQVRTWVISHYKGYAIFDPSQIEPEAHVQIWSGEDLIDTCGSVEEAHEIIDDFLIAP
jgi:hypothetical protein